MDYLKMFQGWMRYAPFQESRDGRIFRVLQGLNRWML